MQLGRYEESIDLAAYRDGLDPMEWPDMDGDLRYFLFRGHAGAERPFAQSNKKRREKDKEDDQNFYHEEVNDPSYVYFLKNIKEHGKSYILEYEDDDDDGVPIKIKYEGDLTVDEECDVEPVRKLRSATKKLNTPSDHMFRVEDQREREMGKKQANKFKSEKEDNARSSNKLVFDPDYNVFVQCSKFSQNRIVFKIEGRTIVYDEGGKNNVGEKDNDASFSGVEIIDPDTFYKKRTPSFSSESLKDEEDDNARSSKKLVLDPDYNVFVQCSKFSQNRIVSKIEGRTIVYDEGGKNNAGEKDNDTSFSGVEIIDPDTFYKKRTSSFSSELRKDEEDDNETEYRCGSSSDTESLEDKEETSKKNKGSVSSLRRTTDFRQDVIADLRKPYDTQEHARLLQAIKHRRQEGRHLDLRNGRERSCSTSKTGKSYLDHYPVVRQKLALVQHDKLKCLNLLRGFFLFLQQSEPPFRPWDDEECCAITPGSDINIDGDYHHKPGL